MSDQLGDGPEHGRPCSIELSPPVSADATAGDGSHPTGDFKRTRLTIAYRDVSLTVPVPVEDEGIHTVISPFVDALKTMTFCGSNLRTREFARVDSISGVLRPSSMTLILAPPGHGKSTFLKVLSSRLPATAGTILYNGLTSQEAAAEGCNTRRLTQYVDQIDEHLPLLTVTETLEFAHRVTCANYDAERVENTVKMLGLEECKDTILGDAIIRGVSGGQKRRVTLGEMLVGDACALFLDEYTNGLDTATSEDITRGLRRWTEQTNGLIVASLQQPTPGLFALFDRVVVLKDSQVVYDGPREDVELYFASMGFNCPEDVDICDFVIDCVSQPRVAFERLQANERRAARGHGGLASAMSGVTIMDPGGPSAATTPAAAFATSVGTLRRAAAPCVTTAQMAAHFKASPMWRETERQLGDIIPAAAGSSPGVPTAVSAVAAAPREPLMPSPETVDMYKVGYTLPLLTLFSVVFGRQWTNLKRNRGIVIPRLAQAMIMGLIFGSLYWQIPTDAFSLRIASLLVSQSEIGFGSMSELASSVDANHIVYKQAGASFYPTYMYVLSAAVCGLPTIFFETAFLSAFYFMSGATYEAGPFLTFYALIISSTWMIGIWFRMMSAIGDDEATAHAISGPSTGFFVLFGGFFVSMSNLPVWMRWIMWISPYSWSLRTLANNEFLSSRYDELNDDGVRIGNVYLEALDMHAGVKWIGLGFLYIIGFAVFCMGLHALMLHRPNHEPSRGTTRFEDEMVDTETDKEIAAEDEAHADEPGLGSPLPQPQKPQQGRAAPAPSVSVATMAAASHSAFAQRPAAATTTVASTTLASPRATQCSSAAAEESFTRLTAAPVDDAGRASQGDCLDIDSKIEVDPEFKQAAATGGALATLTDAKAEADAQAETASELSRVSAAASARIGSFGGAHGHGPNTLQTLREALPFAPTWLTFSDVWYTVKVPGPEGKGTVDRPLLRGVNGYAEPGKLTALMGASGAGKTTLLDVLAGRKNTGVVEGKIMVNGSTPTKTEFARVTGYVEQFDSLLPTDTVRETLLFAAHLRLPADISAEIKRRIVEEVLDILDLTPIGDRVLGNRQNLGLSPSQLKRVNIGCELVANPAVLFLDEPTTGLDSRAAQTVMRVVRRIARSGRSVICTIHQPSAELFYLFDRLVLLASGGYQMYFGDLGTRSKRFVKYLESVPKVQPIPHRVNPASWMLEELGVGVAANKTTRAPAGESDPALGDASIHLPEAAAESEDESNAARVERFIRHYNDSAVSKAAMSRIRTIEALSAVSGQHSAGGSSAAAVDAALDTFSSPPDADSPDGVALGVGGHRRHSHSDAEFESRHYPSADVDAEAAAHARAVADTVRVSQLTLVVSPADGGSAAAPAPLIKIPTGMPVRARRDSFSMLSQASAALPTTLSLSALGAPPGLLHQFTFVMQRSWRSYWRNPAMLLSRFAVMLITSLVIGCIFFQISVRTEVAATAYISALALCGVFCAISATSSAFPGKISDRPVFYRETSSKMYRPWLWLCADLVCDIFWSIPAAIITQIPPYFMIGFLLEADAFFKYFFATYMYMLIFTTAAAAASAAVPNAPVGNIILGVFYSLSFTLTGVSIPLSRVPRGYVWLFRLLPGSHLTEALVMPQLASCSPLPECSPPIEVIVGGTSVQMPLATYVEQYLGFVLYGYWNAIGWATLFMAALLVISFIMVSKVRFDQR